MINKEVERVIDKWHSKKIVENENKEKECHKEYKNMRMDPACCSKIILLI